MFKVKTYFNLNSYLKLALVFLCVSFFVFGFGARGVSAANFFVDNETTCPDGQRTGLDWEHALKTLDEVNIAADTTWWSVPGIDSFEIYFKANPTPYMGNLSVYDFSSEEGLPTTMYFDATGIGTNRGNPKAKLWGAYKQTLVSVSGTLYTLSLPAGNPVDFDPDFSTDNYPIGGNKGVWLVNSSWGFDGLARVATQSEVTAGSDAWYWDSANKIMYVDAGVSIGSGYDIYLTTTSPFELWTGMQVYRGIFQLGTYGEANAGCDQWLVSECEFTHNLLDGIKTASFGRGATILDRSVLAYNGGNGLSFDQSFYGYAVEYGITIQNNLVHNNSKSGIYTKSGSASGSSGNGGINEFNNTIYGNGRYGIEHTAWSSYKTIIQAKNNISFSNTLGQLYCENNANLTLTASNNCSGTANQYFGKWEINKGLGNIELDPLFVNSTQNNFALQNISPAINAGADVGLIYDYVGNSKSGANWDIGAYEFQDSTVPTTIANVNTGLYNTAQSVTLTCGDGIGVGCDKIYYTTDGTNPDTDSEEYSTLIDIAITTTLKFFSTDKNGNSESIQTKTYTIDTTFPIITIVPYITTTINQDITVTASTNEGNLNTTTHTFIQNGSFDFIATDQVGNVTTQTVTITNIDKTPQTVSDTSPKLFSNDTRKSFSATLKSTKIKLKNTNPEIANGKVKIKKGDRTIKESSVDQDGKWSASFSSKNFKVHYLKQDGTEIATSKEYELKIDDEKPKVKTLSPLYIKHRGSIIDWDASDNKAINHYVVTFGNKKYKMRKSQITVPASLKKGSQTFTVAAYDRAGNKSTEKGNLVVTW